MTEIISIFKMKILYEFLNRFKSLKMSLLCVQSICRVTEIDLNSEFFMSAVGKSFQPGQLKFLFIRQ